MDAVAMREEANKVTQTGPDQDGEHDHPLLEVLLEHVTGRSDGGEDADGVEMSPERPRRVHNE